MSTLDTLIQEAQKLHYQLALSSSAVIGHLEGHGVNQDSVYTVAIYEQMGDNTKTAGRLLDQLCSRLASGSSEQATNGAGNKAKATALLDIVDELNLVLEVIHVYESISIENKETTVTGNEVSVLLGLVADQLRPIVEHVDQVRNTIA